MLKQRIVKILAAAPFVSLTFVILFFSYIGSTVSYESKFLLKTLNTVFLALLPFVVSAYAARSYFNYKSSNTFMLGSGTLALGWASLIAGWVMGLPGSPNHTVTVHNTGALIGGIFHFLSAWMSMYAKGDKKDYLPKHTGIIGSYIFIITFISAVAAASLVNLSPPFFLKGEGPTLLRQFVLGSATVLYAASAILFLKSYSRSKIDFFYWYSLALALIAIGLGAVFLQKSVGGGIGWAGRTAQYIAGFYFILAIRGVFVEARRKGLSTEKAIAFLFKDSESSYRSLLRSVQDAIICFDIKGKIFLGNPAAEKMFGYSQNEMRGSNINVFFNKNDDHHIFNEMLPDIKEQSNGQNLSFETFAKNKAGNVFPVEYSFSSTETGGEKLITAVIRDISKRKEVEKVLKRSHAELELLVKQRTSDLQKEKDLKQQYLDIAGVIFVVLDKTGKVTMVNKKACEVLEYQEDEIVGQDWFNNFIPSKQKNEAEAVFRQFISGVIEPVQYYENNIVSKSGEERLIAWHNRYIENDDGEIIGTIGSGDNITERKKAEEALKKAHIGLERQIEERTLELKKTHEQLLHSEKLSAIGGLSASIAHEFNNPLQGVMAIIKGIKRRTSLDEEDAKLVDMAINECNRMKNLIKSLQDFNRPSSGRMAPIDIHAAIDSLLTLSKKEYKKKGVTAETNYAEDIPQIKSVADQIKQVLLNILNNAAYACTEGGTITVSTDVVSKENIAVKIQDTGEGIKPEHIEQIFDPFFSTKPEAKGVGLGLSISYGIIKKHGGKIEVASEPGKGATFTIILPIEGVKNVYINSAG